MAGRYQRRPLTVEAWQFDDAGPEMPDWLERICKRHRGCVIFPNQAIPAAYPGDWIVLHPDGHVAIMACGAFEAEFAVAESSRTATEAAHG